ncbi:MAG: hypothetical protein M1838_004285 [Thelocarpon superellum]|nr:MAG: hypothetical protein M1838_004285 [Thelocarpon superellum]
MTRAKKVAIIGGGPAGLVAAKTLIHSHPSGTFQPTVFEQADSVGGLWPVNQEAQHRFADPDMKTNLSKYTVCFSDLAWESVPLHVGSNGTPSTSSNVAQLIPMLPRAWQVGRYLQTYVAKYLPPSCVRLNSQVIRATREKAGIDPRWTVEWRDQSAANGSAQSTGTSDFEYLIVASGYFGRPWIPPLKGLDTFMGPTIHSSQFRRLSDLFPAGYESRPPPSSAPGKVVVIGGSTSAAEVAATIATHISTAKHAPSAAPTAKYPHVVHVAARPFWVASTVLATNPAAQTGMFNPAPSFLPLDLCLYDLSRYPPGPIKAQPPPVSIETATMFNKYFSYQAGGDQGGLGQGHLGIQDETEQKPPYVAITDRYAGFVRSGDIEPVLGRAATVSPGEDGWGTLTIQQGSGETVIDDVSCIVFATGYRPQSSLDFLEPEVLHAMGYDPECPTVPLLLQQGGTNHASVPGLGFVGFYQGPFWGVMEMQARYLGRRWTGQIDPSLALGQSSTELRRLAAIPGRTPQFIMGDYVGLVEEFADLMSIPRTAIAPTMKEREGPSCPARFQDGYQQKSEDSSSESAKTLASLWRTISSATSTFTSPTTPPPSPATYLVARATFVALQGPWKLERTIRSALSGYPSGRFEGTARFAPRAPTAAGFDEEYLYVEQGTLRTEAGLEFAGSMRYVYRYREEGDTLSVWFVKPEPTTAGSGAGGERQRRQQRAEMKAVDMTAAEKGEEEEEEEEEERKGRRTERRGNVK